MAEFVSAAGGGDLGVELRLETLYHDLEVPFKQYEPETFPGLYFQYNKDGPTLILFHTGKYNIAGGPSIERLYTDHHRLIETIENMLDTELESAKDTFEIRNIVYMNEYDTEFDLEQIALLLGLEHAEYEPEQFPGVLYKPPNENHLFLIYRTGTVILTGTTSRDSTQAFRNLSDDLGPAIKSE